MGVYFYKWMSQPAQWWQFWMPQSGIIGGVILGAVLGVLIILTFRSIR